MATNYGPDLVDSNGNTLTPSNLAHAGQTYFLIVTGMGQTIPAASTNSVGTGEIVPASNVILAINNVGVPVSSVQYQQGARGVYIIAFTLPVPFATGTNLPLALEMTVNSQTFYDNMPVFCPAFTNENAWSREASCSPAPTLSVTPPQLIACCGDSDHLNSASPQPASK